MLGGRNRAGIIVILGALVANHGLSQQASPQQGTQPPSQQPPTQTKPLKPNQVDPNGKVTDLPDPTKDPTKDPVNDPSRDPTKQPAAVGDQAKGEGAGAAGADAVG